MNLAHQILLTLGVLSGPAVIAAVHAVQYRNDPQIGQKLAAKSIARSAPLEKEYVRFRPTRWYDHVASVALIVMPFAQWFAYLRFETAEVFLVPLMLVCSTLFVIQVASPKGAWRNRPAVEKHLKTFVILFGLTLLSFVAASSGTVLVCRGILIDGMALFLTNLGALYAQGRRLAQLEGLG